MRLIAAYATDMEGASTGLEACLCPSFARLYIIQLTLWDSVETAVRLVY